ncbi:hypothetical protein JCM10212_004128 [Sporobolomyces blumeae]
MQGPRFTSHYNRSVPDLTLHVQQPLDDSPKPPPPPPPRASDVPDLSLPTLERASSTRSRPRSTSHHPQDPSERGAASERDNLDPEDGSPLDKASTLERTWSTLKRHAAFVGPGVIASVAYLDPGNWSTDLQAGSAYGYSHLFIVLFAGLMALLFQILATRLGCVSDEDFPTHCRIALHDRPGRFKLFYRWGLLYPLYVLMEIGIVFTDLAELLGSAIAINLLVPKIPLWACVLLTATDVLLILLLFNQYPTRTVTRSMRLFELMIGLLVLVVLGSFVALLVKVEPVWKDAFRGYVPSRGIVDNGGIYIAVGIVGATVMPHAFPLGSRMATMRRIPPAEYGEDDDRLEDDEWYEDQKAKSIDDKEDERGESAAIGTVEAMAARKKRNEVERGRAGRKMFLPSLHLPHPVRIDSFELGQLTSSTSSASSPTVGHANRTVPHRHVVSAAMDNLVITEESRVERSERERDLERDSVGSGATIDARKDATRTPPPPPPEYRRPKPTLACVEAHLGHMCYDVAGSLLGFALVVNSAILILAAAVFYYGTGKSSNPDGQGISDLFDAYDVVKQYIGQAFAYLFAIALLAAGQAASLTVTLSGQIIGEGMIRWRTKPWKRRLITRCIGIVPSLAVSIGVGRQGIDTLLVGSQVALSIVLTFVLVPLIIFTSEHRVMALPDKNHIPAPLSSEALATTPSLPVPLSTRSMSLLKTLNPIRRRRLPPGSIATFANPPAVVWLCWILWWLIAIANVYALYTLSHGEA